MYPISMDKNEEYDIDDLKAQLALTVRYVSVLQEKVKELEKWRMSLTPSKTVFSDFSNTDSTRGSRLGKSIADVTNYPHITE